MNKPNQETLDVFGRIVYAMAMADGEVQDSEAKALHDIVEHDQWAKQIEFSFDMAKKLKMDPWIIFLKNMRIFRARPIDEHYPFFLHLLEEIAKAHDGIVPQEEAMLEKFKSYFEGTGLHGVPRHYDTLPHGAAI